LAALFGRIGLEPGRTVVVVAAGHAPSDFSAAARVYWTLKVSGHRLVAILDGGFAAWAGAGLPTAAGPSQPLAAAPYPVRLDVHIRATAADVERAVSEHRGALVDGRSRAQFEGPRRARRSRALAAFPEPCTSIMPGRSSQAPGSCARRPNSRRCSRPCRTGQQVSYCNTGHLASTNWFVLSEVLKRPGVTLYDGSMSEWAGDPAHPVQTGP
jgi:thiosulfate/3-mercaptopyruvate sulfurtransferase